MIIAPEYTVEQQIIGKARAYLQNDKLGYTVVVEKIMNECFADLDDYDACNRATDLVHKAYLKYVAYLKKDNNYWAKHVDDPNFKLPYVPADGTPDEILTKLREGSRLVLGLTLYRDQQEQHADPVKPKFGSGLAVPISLVGYDAPVYLDENGINVYTGEKLNLSPKGRELLDKELNRRRRQKADAVVEELDAEKEPHSRYGLTEEEYERETEKEFPVFHLPQQAGPWWDDSILYGPAGDVIRKISQYNESHPAGMLVDLLISIGSIIGRGPYFNVNATRHYTNEFMVRVGVSSKSRKGSGRDAIDSLLKILDPQWFDNQIEKGFGSGEAIINRLRDTVVETRLNKAGVFEEHTVPGVTDKRLCVREGEFASILVLARKPESRADVVLRDGWDGATLRNTVKGKTRDGFSNSTKCDEPHLSISADTTIDELRLKMPPGADSNGFGNRFLYVYVTRLKKCPNGGPTLDWSEEFKYFLRVKEFATTVKLVSMTDQARKWWNRRYSDLDDNGDEHGETLAVKMTNRGPAHLRRIAMLYALIDLSSQIKVRHFQAALKLWNYCQESAMFIFDHTTKEQHRIVSWINMRGPVTFRQIREEMYRRNRLASEVKADLDCLVRNKRLILKGDLYATGAHIGRLV